MRLKIIKSGLTFSEAIEHIQSGDSRICIRRKDWREVSFYKDEYLGFCKKAFKSETRQFATFFYNEEYGFDTKCGDRILSDKDIFAKDWEVYKYEGKEL